MTFDLAYGGLYGSVLADAKEDDPLAHGGLSGAVEMESDGPEPSDDPKVVVSGMF